MELFSRRFFKENFFEVLLELGSVSHPTLSVCRVCLTLSAGAEWQTLGGGGAGSAPPPHHHDEAFFFIFAKIWLTSSVSGHHFLVVQPLLRKSPPEVSVTVNK